MVQGLRARARGLWCKRQALSNAVLGGLRERNSYCNKTAVYAALAALRAPIFGCLLVSHNSSWSRVLNTNGQAGGGRLAAPRINYITILHTLVLQEVLQETTGA